MRELRVRQDECLNSIRTEYIAGIHQQLVVQATGTGKTVIFSNLWERLRDLLPGRMLVFAHREELIKQAAASLRDWNPSLKVGIEMAGQYADLDCQVIVSCVASIGREGSKRMARFGWDSIDKIICDEAHHSIAQTYLNVFNDAGVLLPDTKKLLVGFTATPKRKNRERGSKQTTTLDEESLLSLKSVYKKIVYSYPIRKAIKEGWLVPLKGFRLKTETDLTEVKSVGGDYQQDQLSETVDNDQRNEQIVAAWKKWGENRQTLGFTVDIAHAQHLAEKFRAAGENFIPIWGNDPERAKKLEAHKRQEIKGLLNAQLLTEGYDDWRIKCIILAAPTKSPSKYGQEIGRGTRLQDGTGNLLEALAKGVPLEKRDCYILDVVDNNKRCTLVTFPSLIGLPPDFDLHGADAFETLEKVEALEEKYPTVDFSKLLDLDKVNAYIESVDLFAEPYTQEVLGFSELMWMQTGSGSYVLAIPEDKAISDAKEYWRYKHEKLVLVPNELDQWELYHRTVETEKKLGIYNDLKYAFDIADDIVKRCRGDRMRLLTRTDPWHLSMASDAAKSYLRKLTKKHPVLWCLCEGYRAPGKTCPKCGMKTGLTAGQASLAISLLKARNHK